MNSAPATSVLIVEDERLIAADLQQSLCELGYDACAIAASAEEALACVKQRCPDVILMDIRIAGPLDGIQTASVLQRQCPAIIIYLTASLDAATVERAKQTAPQGYLIKPVKGAELRSTIEIAVHNRQLDADRGERRAAERRASVISDNIPLAVAYFDGKGKVQYANRAFRELVPYRGDPIGVAAHTFLGGALYQKSLPARQRALLGETAGYLVEIERAGVIRHHEVTYIPDHDAPGDVCGVYALSHDVTEREQLTADLRLARRDLVTLLNAVPASITSWQKDLTFRFANRTAKAQFPAPLGTIVGEHMCELIGAGRFAQILPHVKRALAGHDSIVESTETVDGSMRYTCHYFIPEWRGSAVAGIYALGFDITELRESQESIRRLAQRLEHVREEEQEAVATILHDGIAQDLFAARLGVDTLAESPPEHLPQLCRELGTALERCMDDTRQLGYSLRPAALVRSGVSVAIAEHASYFGAQAHLVIEADCTATLPPLSDAGQHLLFRAAQEALTNVARHAQAHRVSIKLWSDTDQVWLTVADDGVGIRANALVKRGSLGLLALRERFSAAGGSVTLARAHPSGTVVTFAFPSGRESAARAH